MTDTPRCAHGHCTHELDVWLDGRPLCQKHFEEEINAAHPASISTPAQKVAVPITGQVIL